MNARVATKTCEMCESWKFMKNERINVRIFLVKVRLIIDRMENFCSRHEVREEIVENVENCESYFHLS